MCCLSFLCIQISVPIWLLLRVFLSNSEAGVEQNRKISQIHRQDISQNICNCIYFDSHPVCGFVKYSGFVKHKFALFTIHSYKTTDVQTHNCRETTFVAQPFQSKTSKYTNTQISEAQNRKGTESSLAPTPTST